MVLFQSIYIYDKIFLQNYYRNIWSFLLFSLTINLNLGKRLVDPQIDVTVVFVVIFILVVLLVAVAVLVVFVLSKRKTLGLAYPYHPTPIQLQEYQTDMGRCSRLPHIAETSALVTKTLV